jgi:hypothetical protein
MGRLLLVVTGGAITAPPFVLVLIVSDAVRVPVSLIAGDPDLRFVVAPTRRVPTLG